MTEDQDAAGAVPDWDVADKMRKALRHAELAPGEMADYLQVGRNTVSTWINGRVRPSMQTLRLWALKTGVSYEWLTDGYRRPPRSRARNRSQQVVVFNRHYRPERAGLELAA